MKIGRVPSRFKTRQRGDVPWACTEKDLEAAAACLADPCIKLSIPTMINHRAAHLTRLLCKRAFLGPQFFEFLVPGALYIACQEQKYPLPVEKLLEHAHLSGLDFHSFHRQIGKFLKDMGESPW